jgi:hypothetical protein
VSLIFSRGRQFHKSILHSPWVLLTGAFVLASNLFILFQDFPVVYRFFELPSAVDSFSEESNSSSGSSSEPAEEAYNPAKIPYSFRFIILMMAMANFLVSVLVEEVTHTLLPKVATKVVSLWQDRTSVREKRRKEKDRLRKALLGQTSAARSLDRKPSLKSSAKAAKKGKAPEPGQMLPTERSSLLWNPTSRDIRIYVTEDSASESDAGPHR